MNLRNLFNRYAKINHEQNLKIHNSEIKRNDLEYCLMDCLVKRTFLHTQKEYLLTKEEQYKFNNYTNQLKKTIPLAYITGSQPFYKNQFIVSPEVLIPRPETEILVEEVINSGEKMYSKNQPVKILDLGAGTGCIGLSIAAEKPEWLIYLSDIEIEIARVICMNKIKLNLKNCEIIVTDWMSAFSKNSFDIVVTNPHT